MKKQYQSHKGEKIQIIEEEFLLRVTLQRLKQSQIEAVKMEYKKAEEYAYEQWQKIKNPLLNKYFKQMEKSLETREVEAVEVVEAGTIEEGLKGLPRGLNSNIDRERLEARQKRYSEKKKVKNSAL